jgi:hypothetical protein
MRFTGALVVANGRKQHWQQALRMALACPGASGRWLKNFMVVMVNPALIIGNMVIMVI